jgi:hypothetical protein
MILSSDQLNIFSKAIKEYSFPCAYYDFNNNCTSIQSEMIILEKLIKDDLLSGDRDIVKNGLSNVLYWGFAKIGYRDIRVSTFRNQVSNGKLDDAIKLFSNINDDGLKEIKKIGLPQFSGMSFISKIRMFLDPKNYVILDQQILKMNNNSYATILNDISFGTKETQIRISDNNCDVYRRWCKKCINISNQYFNNTYRAVDIERGFFTLIQKGHIDIATEILSVA